MVAGIIAAKTNNNRRGIAGIAGGKGGRGVTVIPLSVGNSNNRIDESVIDNAIDDAVEKGAKVINMSIGGPVNSEISAAISRATQSGVVIVAASGNDETPPITGGSVTFPASHSDVIAVGATSQGNWRMDFSNYGPGFALNLVAPGSNILSTALNGGYKSASGTSFAAPQVAAIAALIWSKYPDFTRQQVIDIIHSTADRYPNKHTEYGYGLVNAHRALFGHLVISGEDYTAPNTTVHYSLPSATPLGVSFNGWTISPSTYTVTGGTTSSNLTIKFTASTTYTLTAKYRLPDGTFHNAQKIVDTRAPSITAHTWQSSGGPGVPATPGNYCFFTVTGDLNGATLEWTKGSGCDPALGYVVNHNTYAAAYDGSDDYYITVYVRAQRGGMWSSTYTCMAPVDPYAPAPQSDEEEEDTEDAADESDTSETSELIVAELAR
jgi:hypothetical protein